MAEIIFRPVCSICGGVLYCDVNIAEDLLEASANSKEPWATKVMSIDPICCPHCGEAFEKIVLPTRLPYRVDIMG